MKKTQIRKIVKKRYGQIANSASDCGCSCNCGNMGKDDIAKSIGYSDKEISSVPDANLGLGCGNPTALGELKPGMVVLDLGCGAGFDCFIAARKVGKTGKVIGVDMAPAMVKKAKANAGKYGFDNVEFRLGEIEQLPVESNSIDAIISNCVINLSPDKKKVFKEAYRVLKKGGKMLISDIVLLKELSDEQRNDVELLTGCVGGAILKGKYLEMISKAGFALESYSEDAAIGERQYGGLPVESLRVVVRK